MKFFDKKLDDDKQETLEDENNNQVVDNSYVGSNLDVNSKNSAEFDRLMENASTNYDSYWDKNNPLVKAIMIILFIIIVIGVAYYIISWCSFK